MKNVQTVLLECEFQIFTFWTPSSSSQNRTNSTEYIRCFFDYCHHLLFS